MAKNIAADQHIPMAFFSLEMTDVQLANRLMSNACMIEGQKLLSGQMDREDWKRLDKYLSVLTDAPLYIDDTEGLSVMELRSKARRLKKEHDIQLIMVDYLQLMTASGMRYNSRQEEVSLISRSLKGLAKDLNVPVLALSQLNRGVESREGVVMLVGRLGIQLSMVAITRCHSRHLMHSTLLATTRHDIIFIARLVKIWKYSKHFVILYPK